MYDAGKIVPGLAIFLGILTMPFWYTAATGKGSTRPEPELPKDRPCVESTSYMRDSHMDLLNQWRDAVVRRGEHVYVAKDGRHYDMSLSNTCMKCHTDRSTFCDRCHNYVSAKPVCWDCHSDRMGVR